MKNKLTVQEQVTRLTEDRKEKILKIGNGGCLLCLSSILITAMPSADTSKNEKSDSKSQRSR